MSEEQNIQQPAAPEVPVPPKPPIPEAPAADLNISDLVALKSIIEVASQRGAFKATELEAVGKTFNKLNAFLEAVAKKEA